VKIDIVTIFPEMIRGALGYSILSRAQQECRVTINVTDMRDFTADKRKTVDDAPYGGGAGMVLKPEPIFDAVESLTPGETGVRVILMTPQGRPFSQEIAKELAAEQHIVLICGHYEGFDERIREHLATDEISVGDYVLTGGELPALIVVDAVSRLLPGVLGNDQSLGDETFENDLLEYPQYTRPFDFRGWPVPDVLLSGHHAQVAQWRLEQQESRTRDRRPDLWEKYAERKALRDAEIAATKARRRKHSRAQVGAPDPIIGSETIAPDGPGIEIAPASAGGKITEEIS
jgi:tRNA (guanine37-N1)-methyltransferase